MINPVGNVLLCIKRVVYVNCSVAERCTVIDLLGTVISNRSSCSFFSAMEAATLLQLLYSCFTRSSGYESPELRRVSDALRRARRSLVSLGVWPEVVANVQKVSV